MYKRRLNLVIGSHAKDSAVCLTSGVLSVDTVPSPPFTRRLAAGTPQISAANRRPGGHLRTGRAASSFRVSGQFPAATQHSIVEDQGQ